METGQKENATRAFLPINLIFLKKVGVVPRKAAKLEKVVPSTPQNSRPGNDGNLFGFIVTF